MLVHGIYDFFFAIALLFAPVDANLMKLDAAPVATASFTKAADGWWDVKGDRATTGTRMKVEGDTLTVVEPGKDKRTVSLSALLPTVKGFDAKTAKTMDLKGTKVAITRSKDGAVTLTPEGKDNKPLTLRYEAPAKKKKTKKRGK